MNCRIAVLGLLGLLGCAGIASAQQAHIIPDLASGEIDHLIRVEWKSKDIVPAARVDDARFLRRVYLDVIGKLPPPDAITAFLADRRPDKRELVVDQLLADPAYAEHWTNYWDAVLMGRQSKIQQIDRGAFKRWLYSEFQKNVPFNKFVYDLITATGQNSAGGTYRDLMVASVMKPDAMASASTAPAGQAMAAGQQMAADTTMMAPGGANGTPNAANVNGAVNWYFKEYRSSPADLAGTASKIFLGVQIQCAQCHDHKTEKWKQADFRRFTSCFLQARPVPLGKPEKGMIPLVDLEDLNRPLRRYARRPKAQEKLNELQTYLAYPPEALDGSDFSDVPNRRQALAAWMTADQNPWFAEAIVNRMWSHFMGRGFVEPVDDFRPSNPAAAPDVLAKLADDFKEHHYDLKHLIKLICDTQVYNLSSGPAPSVDPNNQLWARFRLKALAPDEMMDALVDSTGFGPALERFAGNRIDQIKFAMTRQFTFLFDVDEEFEQKEFEGTITQAMMLMNGNITNRAVTPIPGTALAETVNEYSDDRSIIQALYLRTVSHRKPTAVETKRWLAFLNAPRPLAELRDAPAGPALARYGQGQGKNKMKRNGGFDPLAGAGRRFAALSQSPKMQAYEDMFWALLNSSEFQFNH